MVEPSTRTSRRSATGYRHPPRRADRAPGRCRAGAGAAWRRTRTGRGPQLGKETQLPQDGCSVIIIRVTRDLVSVKLDDRRTAHRVGLAGSVEPHVRPGTDPFDRSKTSIHATAYQVEVDVRDRSEKPLGEGT